MKVGLIELNVDISQCTADDAGEAIRETLCADPASRMTTALAALDAARDEHCDLIVMPGYTVVSKSPPRKIIDRSKGCTIVFECLWPGSSGVDKDVDRPWGVFVAQDEQLIISAARQQFSAAAHVRDGGSPSAAVKRLVRELTKDGRRRWSTNGHDCTLLICGEVNLAEGSEASGLRRCDLVEGIAAEVKPLVRGAGRLLINPSHTWSTLPWMADKRAWFSRGGWALHTANTHTAYSKIEEVKGSKKTKIVRGRSSRCGAAVWQAGSRRALKCAVKETGFAVHTLTIP